jgi:hypothetical protein
MGQMGFYGVAKREAISAKRASNEKRSDSCRTVSYFGEPPARSPWL